MDRKAGFRGPQLMHAVHNRDAKKSRSSYAATGKQPGEASDQHKDRNTGHNKGDERVAMKTPSRGP